MTFSDVMVEQYEPIKEVAQDSFPEDLATLLAYIDIGDPAASAVMAAEALESIIAHFRLPLARQAKKFNGVRCLGQDDFTQTGIEGVFDAITRADTSYSPSQFRSYAALRVHSAMFEQSAQAGGLVNLNEGALKKIIAVSKIDQEVALQPEGGKTAMDIANEDGNMGWRLYCFYKSVKNLIYPLSYEAHVTESMTEISAAWSDGLPDTMSIDPAEIYENKETIKLLAGAINLLDDRDKIVVTMYYIQSMTLASIGEVLGVTESRICQIMGRARIRLRASLEELGVV